MTMYFALTTLIILRVCITLHICWPKSNRELYTNNWIIYYLNVTDICLYFCWSISAGINRATCTRECRKRKRLGEDNCNNVPKRTKSHAERQHEYTVEKHIKSYLLNTCVITENPKLRKIKRQKWLRQMTLQQL
jgi:hypothetical protein